MFQRMGTGKRFPLLALLGLALLPLRQAGAAERIVLADNSQVLAAWQQNSGGGAAPQLVEQEGGTTVLQWQGGVVLDWYRNSSSGGHLLTPQRSESFYRAQAHGDLRGTAPGGAVSYLQFAGSHSDDPAVLSHAPGGQIDSLQMGRTGANYHLAMGDVAVNFSTLGSNLGLRGLMGQGLLGKTLVAGAAGFVTDGWNALGDEAKRSRYLRQVFAAKVETPLAGGTRVFVTGQGYEDDAATLDDERTFLAAASQRSATAGFAWERGRFALQGEAGASRWQEEGQERQRDRAFIADAGWSQESIVLRFGHHDIGMHYASLTAHGGNGVQETYLNGSWMAASWLNLTADLRHSENEMAAGQGSVNSSKTDSLATTAVVTFGPQHPAWTLLLSQSLSDGENGDSASNRNEGYGATVAYAAEGWQSSLGYNLLDVENRGDVSSSSRTDIWVFNLGRNWLGSAGTAGAEWSLGSNFAATLQDQKLDQGDGPRTLTWQLGLLGQRAGWGSCAASYTDATTDQGGDRGDLRQRSWLVEAARPFRGGHALKLFFKDNRLSGSSADQAADYRERSTGLQIAFTL
jgi:hypothetical protein